LLALAPSVVDAAGKYDIGKTKSTRAGFM
jgi:hypothetical protein